MSSTDGQTVGQPITTHAALMMEVRAALALKVLELDDARALALDAWFDAGMPLPLRTRPATAGEHLEEAQVLF
jgi:hypothetical protein